jgi:hypothetical protein
MGITNCRGVTKAPHYYYHAAGAIIRPEKYRDPIKVYVSEQAPGSNPQAGEG